MLNTIYLRLRLINKIILFNPKPIYIVIRFLLQFYSTNNLCLKRQVYHKKI